MIAYQAGRQINQWKQENVELQYLHTLVHLVFVVLGLNREAELHGLALLNSELT